MPVYKDNKGRYFIKAYVKDEFGKPKQITKRNKEWVGRKGKELALQEEVRIKNGGYLSKNTTKDDNIKTPKEKQVILLNEVIKKYQDELKKHDKESTYYGHNSVIKNQIIPYLGNKNIMNLTTFDIIKWHNKLNDLGYKPNYKKKCHTILKSILQTGNIYFGLDKNVAAIVGNFKKTKEEKEQIKVEEKIKYITYEQFETFISVIVDPLWNTFFNLLYFTGMRKGEVQALTWEDVDFQNKKISVTKTLTVKTYEKSWKITSTKNEKNRKIDMDDRLNFILYKYYLLKSKNSFFSNSDFVFGEKEPLKQHRIDYNREKYFKLSGVSIITNHEFRHSHVSLMINSYLKQGNTDVKKFFIIMSARMGHTIEVMEKTYLHLFPDIQKPVVNLINELNKENYENKVKNKVRNLYKNKKTIDKQWNYTKMVEHSGNNIIF